MKMSHLDLLPLFGALNNPIRLEILEILRAEGEQHAGQFVSRFDLAQGTVSRHLHTLSNADLVLDERRGQEGVLLTAARHAGLAGGRVLRAF